MGMKQSFFLAVKSLATSKMRSLLTMLGIIIGVAAVIVIISLGDGMQKMLNDEFESMGANMIQVSVWDSGSSRTVTPVYHSRVELSRGFQKKFFRGRIERQAGQCRLVPLTLLIQYLFSL